MIRKVVKHWTVSCNVKLQAPFAGRKGHRTFFVIADNIDGAIAATRTQADVIEIIGVQYSGMRDMIWDTTNED